MIRKTLIACLSACLLAGALVAGAQDGNPLPPGPTPGPSPTPTGGAPADPEWPLIVTVPASDDLPLVGAFYPVDPARPTVLLLHQLYTDRTSWEPLLDPLLFAGYNVLAVDLRGYGDTGSAIDWPQAVDDVGTWVAWLGAESGLSNPAVAMIGSSMGSSLALAGCANAPDCPTAIAISPGWAYQGLEVGDALATGMGDRPALLVYALRDAWPMRGVPRLVEVATNPVTVLEFPGNAHGMDLLDAEAEALVPQIVEWLGEFAG